MRFSGYLFILTFWINTVFSQSGTTIIDSIYSPYSGGNYRSYRLYIPPIYSGSVSVPLILNLHGYTSNAYQQQMLYTSSFMQIADTAGFLMVYPQGTKDSYGNAFWNSGTYSISIVNDTTFLNQLIDSLQSSYNVDPTKIYMTGFSNGAIMSHYMACFCNKKITAIASVSGTILKSWPNCNPNKNVPVMHLHGTSDAIVSYNGDANMLSADSTVMKWVFINNCNPVPSYSMVPNTNIIDGSTAEHYRYFQSGNPKSIVELFKLNNAGHTCPGSPYGFGATNLDINGPTEIWRFFRQFSSSDFTTYAKTITKDIDFILYPNPTSDIIYVYSSSTPINQIEIKDITGKIILKKEYDNYKDNVLLSVENIDKGIYFVFINKELISKKLVIQ